MFPYASKAGIKDIKQRVQIASLNPQEFQKYFELPGVSSLFVVINTFVFPSRIILKLKDPCDSMQIGTCLRQQQTKGGIHESKA